MAAVWAVLRAVARAQWRDLRTLGSIAGNNFFLFVVLLMQQPKSAVFFLVLLGALVLVPLSADPLRVAPADRLALWPLSGRQQAAIRAGSLALSPVLWIVLGLVLRTGRMVPALEVAGVVVLAQAAAMVSGRVGRRRPGGTFRRWIPAFGGTASGLIRKDLLQMVSTLDFYIACLLAGIGLAYRFAYPAHDPAAIPIIALMVVLALSTYAQCLFGLDGPAGIMRYRLWPLQGWKIILAKDAAWLAVTAVLVAGLSPMAGLTGAFAALAVGHHASVRKPGKQQRWRFTSGSLLPTGLVQVIALFASGTAAERSGTVYLAASIVAWAGSVTLYGWLWDRTRE